MYNRLWQSHVCVCQGCYRSLNIFKRVSDAEEPAHTKFPCQWVWRQILNCCFRCGKHVLTNPLLQGPAKPLRIPEQHRRQPLCTPHAAPAWPRSLGVNVFPASITTSEEAPCMGPRLERLSDVAAMARTSWLMSSPRMASHGG